MTPHLMVRDAREPESIPKRSRRQPRRFEETCRRSEIYDGSWPIRAVLRLRTFDPERMFKFRGSVVKIDEISVK